MSAASRPFLVAAVGDIHGRFHRVQEWMKALEAARGRPVDAVLAVGDVEAFQRADDHRRKAAKRSMPAEFSEYASGARRVHRPLHFIGGNNEDFAVLHRMPDGGEVAPDVHYLGRVGVRTLGQIKVAYLSGIHAPRFVDRPLLEPRTAETYKQAGYFRTSELARLADAREPDVMLVHEWPRGLVRRQRQARPLRAHRFPWIGNPVTRQLVEALGPAWLFCGHSHVPYAATFSSPEGKVTRVVCLDQAARPEGAVFWVEFSGGAAARAGWGIDGRVAWERGAPWSEADVPADGGAEAHPSEPGM